MASQKTIMIHLETNKDCFSVGGERIRFVMITNTLFLRIFANYCDASNVNIVTDIGQGREKQKLLSIRFRDIVNRYKLKLERMIFEEGRERERVTWKPSTMLRVVCQMFVGLSFFLFL